MKHHEDMSYVERFNENWVFEIPQYTGKSGNNPYDTLVYALRVNIDSGSKPENLGNGLHRLIVDNQDIYYWMEINDNVDIIVAMKVFRRGLAVNLIGKRNGATTYASDFYQNILNSITGSLLFSGDQLSDEGFKVWERLLNYGRTIMVYDPSNTDHYKKLNTVQELKDYLGSEENYKKYRYVLSENVRKQAPPHSDFELLRAYKLTFNIPL